MMVEQDMASMEVANLAQVEVAAMVVEQDMASMEVANVAQVEVAALVLTETSMLALIKATGVMLGTKMMMNPQAQILKIGKMK